jgi:hypothetical protein
MVSTVRAVPQPDPTAQADRDFSREVAAQLLESVSAIVDKELALGEFECSRREQRSAGEGQVHINFKFKFSLDGQVSHGCLLLPLTQAVAAACSMLMMPVAQVGEICSSGSLDTPIKDALLELGNMLASSLGAPYQEPCEQVSVQFAGCQGVRAGVRPAIPYREGSPLLTIEAHSIFEPFGRFRFLLLLPPPWGPEGPAAAA